MEESKRSNRRLKKTLIIAGIIIVFIFSNFMFFYMGNLFAFNGISLISVSDNVAKDISEVKDVEKYELLFQVREALLTKYDGEIDDNNLLQSAIKGMTDSLNDPYTVFMNSDEFKSFMEQSEGHFVGIGAQLGIKDNKITVIAPIEGSPAEKAGLKAGDVILKVDDKEITDPNLDTTISLIRGDQGEPVTLNVLRGDSEYLDITIVRDEIKINSVSGEIVDGNIGYIQISSFDEDVSKSFQEKIIELKSQGMKGMILDLRGNPGGLLGESIKVASQFIPEGKVITYTIDKYENKKELKSFGGESEGIPLVILIDGGSASASEVVTGALRDYKVGTIIGTNSFGKGVVQELIGFEDGDGGLKVTTSKYYTPNGENIHKIGIKPDIEVKISEEMLKQEYDRSVDPQFNKGLEVIKEKIK